MITFKQFLTENSHNVYYRGTNNKNEVSLLNRGKLRPSLNHVTNKPEIGLSVSDVLEPIQQYFDYVYKVMGQEIGVGSDGEPILDLTTVHFVKWVKR